MLSYVIDDRRKVIVPGNLQTTLDYSARHLLDSAKEAIKEKSAFYIALSGGSTPKAIYERLASKQDALDWSKVFIFWSDERSVGPTHPDSNYAMAMKAGIGSLPIPPGQIFRMAAEENIEESAKEYEQIIKDTLKDRPFDYIMLGMGEDGHTASLFPNTKGLEETDRLIIPNFIPQKSTWRMTMTFPCINASRQAVFYVLGANKKEMLEQVMVKTKDTFPCQYVGTKQHPSLWIADEEAASWINAKAIS